MIGKMREYMSLCPLFEGRKINSDFLSEKTESYALYAEDGEVVIKEYASGDCLKQFVFSLRYRAPYGASAHENDKISAFFADVAEWIEKNNEDGFFPDAGAGKVVQSIDVLKNAHIRNTNVSDCVYEMKLRAVYYELLH